MKMLPTLGKDSSITENGHFLVRPSDGGYVVVNTVTDETYTYTTITGTEVVANFALKEHAENSALSLAQAALDA